jgi:molybdopterin converting factor small subunit
MQIRLVYHGDLQSYTGKNVEMLHLDDSATIASLISRLGASHPQALPFLAGMLMSRGGQAVTADAFLADGDIIDICLGDTAIA